jgi:hypothetical protein
MAFGDGEDEEIPVRSPITVAVAPVASNQDENDWSTLVNIYNDIKQQMVKCDSVAGLDLKKADGLTIEQQIAVNQKVIEVLEPIAAEIESAVQDIQLKTKERYQ